MQIQNDIKLDFSDVLILPKTSAMESRSVVTVERTFQLPHAGWKWTGIPLIAANMDTIGTVQMFHSLSDMKCLTALHKHYDLKELSEMDFYSDYLFYSMGISDKDYEKFIQFTIQNHLPKLICIDVANGYTQKFIDYVKKIREYAKDSFIMAGNVVTGGKTEELIRAGADCVKVGIGPGSVCLTRSVAGVGMPQLSAIIECADAAHGLKGLICSDGGCVVPGDVSKAFGANADFVMVGGMLSGTAECGGDIITKDNKQYVEFYGMSSAKANDKYNGGLKDYKASEGREILVEYKGPVKDVVNEILGGVRSTMSYVGASELKHLSLCTTFIRVNRQLNQVFEGK